jgi:hypothetical protein
MTNTLFILTGTALTLLALLLFSIPSLRPRVYTRRTGWLGAAMLLPLVIYFVIGYVFKYHELIIVVCMIKPITAMLGVTLFFGSVIMSRSKRLPLITTLPSFLLLCGSVTDLLVAYQILSNLGGASC